MHRLIFIFCLLAPVALAQDILQTPGYPQRVSSQGVEVAIHRPVIDAWHDWKTVEGWVPVEVRIPGTQKRWLGAFRARAHTRVNPSGMSVSLTQQELLRIHFKDQDVPAQAEELIRSAVIAREKTVTTDRLMASVSKDFKPPEKEPPESWGNFRIVIYPFFYPGGQTKIFSDGTRDLGARDRGGYDYATLDELVIPPEVNPDDQFYVDLEGNVYERIDNRWVRY